MTSPADSAVPDVAEGSDADALDPFPNACLQLEGIYRVDSTCNGQPSQTASKLVCLRQDACSGEIAFHFGSGPTVMTLNGVGWTGETADTDGVCQGDADDTGFSFACEDGDFGNGQCAGTAVRLDVPNATRFCCDIAGDDCAGGERCAVIYDSPAGRAATACVPVVAEALAEGATCTLPTGLEADTCGAGLTCSPLGEPEGTAICQRLCGSPSDCHSGETCVSDIPRSIVTGGAAVCRSSCDPLAPGCDGEDSCGAGFTPTTNGTLGRIAWCGPSGTLEVGAACDEATRDCGPDLFCLRTALTPAACRAPCDTADDCGAGEVCEAAWPPMDPSVTSSGEARFCFPEP